MNKNNTSREYTKDEIVRILLAYLHDDIPNICKLSFGENYSSENVLFIVLGALDGETLELPGFELIPIIDGKEYDDIGGELHSLLLQKKEKLNELLASGMISKLGYSFITKMKELAVNCNRDMIVSEVLKTIDLGVSEDFMNYTKFKLKPISHQEDIDIAIERGINYYPIDAPDISGQLVKTYYTLYPDKKIIQGEEPSNAVTEEK